MIFEQIKIELAAAVVVAALAGGFASGWAVNGWRLGVKVEHAERERDLAIAQGTQLAEATRACNAGVERTEKLAAQAIDQGRALLAEAKRLNAGHQAQVGRIEDLLKKPPPDGADCNKAWQEIEALNTGGQVRRPDRLGRP